LLFEIAALKAPQFPCFVEGVGPENPDKTTGSWSGNSATNESRRPLLDIAAQSGSQEIAPLLDFRYVFLADTQRLGKLLLRKLARLPNFRSVNSSAIKLSGARASTSSADQSRVA